MKKIWSFLDGKKTSIGTIAFIAACMLNEVVKGIWHVDVFWLDPSIETLNWVGVAFGGTGLAHKLSKSKPVK